MRTILLITILLIAACAAVADVPPMINYQGKLLQPSGAPVPDGTYSMQFAIYNVPTGGTALTALWSETNPSVQVKGGLFATLLGSVVNLPANIFNGPNTFFGVTVGTDPEMTPRQQIASSAFAFRAYVAGTVDSGAIGTTQLTDGAVTASKLATGAVTANAIASGAVTSAGIADGAVTATKLDTGAITLGYAETFENFLFMGTAVHDVPGLTLTLTIPSGGRRLKVTAVLPVFYTDTGYNQVVRVYEDSTTRSYLQQVGSGANSNWAVTSICSFTPTAGVHTYKVQVQQSNNGNMYAGGLNPGLSPAFLLAERI